MRELQPGDRLGERFAIVGTLGRGGMATVHLAVDELRGERVALKVLHPHLGAQPSMRARLRREVQAASRLRHPSILVPHEIHELQGRLALSMPLHPGVTLQEHVQTHGPLDPRALRRLVEQLSGALAAAHRQGVVHRDVTPNNVMIAPDGSCVLTDFGLARLEGDHSRTATGALGTAGYAAPEVYRGERGEPRSDLYGLGAVAWFAATGAAPFDAPTPMGVLQRQLADDLPPLASRRPDLPAALSRTIDALLRLEPRQRPAGASAVLDALQGAGPEPPGPPQPALPAPRGLPAGDWTVMVKEMNEDRNRRETLRHRYKHRHRKGEVAQVLEEVVRRGTRAVRDLLGLPEEDRGRPPEELLTEAVAREAGLPTEALELAPEVLERRFRLVDGVDEPTARRLARRSSELGFKAEAASVRQSRRAAHRVEVAERVGLLLTLLLVLTGIGVIPLGLQGVLPFALIAVVWGVVVPLVGGQADRKLHKAPVAYHRDLRPHLAEGYLQLASALDPHRQPDEAAPLPAAQGSTPAPEEELVGRAEARLLAFERALAGRAGELADHVVEELTDRARSLRRALRPLAAEAGRLRSELASTDDAAESAAAGRIEGRLERLQTLQRAGEAVDPAEVARLQRALSAHRDAVDAAEEAEARLTLVMGELLEIGAAATRAVRLLEGERELAGSVPDLLQQLRREAEAAGRALEEVAPSAPPLRRERAGESAPSPRRPGDRERA